MRHGRLALGVLVLGVALAGCKDPELRDFFFEDPNAAKWSQPSRDYDAGSIPDGNAYLEWLEGEIEDLADRVCDLEQLIHTVGGNTHGHGDCPDPDPTAPPPWPPR